MKLQFFKYQGAGNDFILIDNRKNLFNHRQPAIIAALCDRRFGVGGDGLMCLESKEGYDFEMVYYNSDGQPSSMCGNGGRCIVAFAKDLGIIDTETNFLAVDGPHYAKISDEGYWVSLQMIDVSSINSDGDAYVLNTGSPHYVCMASNLKELDVFSNGKSIRYNDTYKADGINVNFVEEDGDGYFVRTYERGVENETFACGTGVTAVALAMAKHKKQLGQINTPIRALGGDLNVRFSYDGERYSTIFLEGPAKFVFEGAIQL
jgi:diaminopimelate epimerase